MTLYIYLFFSMIRNETRQYLLMIIYCTKWNNAWNYRKNITENNTKINRDIEEWKKDIKRKHYKIIWRIFSFIL